MPESQQTRPLTTDEQFRILFARTAKLNDGLSALIDPEWGAKAGLLPITHPLHPSARRTARREAEAANAAAVLRTAEAPAPVDWEAVVRDRERELKTVGEQKRAVEQERDGAYRERAHLVALIAAMTDSAVIAPASDVEESGWQIAYLRIGGEQCSWHIAPRDVSLFATIEHVAADDPRAQWDGHTTEQKYAYIAARTADLMAECGPACSEMHRGGFRCKA